MITLTIVRIIIKSVQDDSWFFKKHKRINIIKVINLIIKNDLVCINLAYLWFFFKKYLVISQLICQSN